MEAPDNGTVVHHTGAARSAPGTLTGHKLPHSQSRTGESQGGRKRALSDTSSSNNSSRRGNSIKANHENTSTKDIKAKRRRQSGRPGNHLERHRHHSVSGVPGNGAPRAGARAGAARYCRTVEQGQAVDEQRDDERHDDEDGNDPWHDIQARLTRIPNIIMSDTWANRPP